MAATRGKPTREVTSHHWTGGESLRARRGSEDFFGWSLSLSLLAARQCPEKTPTADNKEFVEALACRNNKVCGVWIDTEIRQET